MKNKMTKEQHIEFGRQIKQFRRLLIQPHVLNAYGKSSPQAKSAWRTYNALERMKSDFDNAVCRDYSTADWYAPHCYYGHPQYS
jgi:hypothetical protein